MKTHSSQNKLILSPLCHTWILDLDGTVLKHNGYRDEGEDTFLPGALSFLHGLPSEDMVIFLTSRTQDQQQSTVVFLAKHHIRYDHILFNAPYGERILVNDRKPSGLPMAHAWNLKRDTFDLVYEIDSKL